MIINCTLTTNTDEVNRTALRISKILESMMIRPFSVDDLAMFVDTTSALALSIHTQHHTLTEATLVYFMNSKAFETVSQDAKVEFRQRIIHLKREIRFNTPECQKVYWGM